jgi:hypothetical protein
MLGQGEQYRDGEENDLRIVMISRSNAITT